MAARPATLITTRGEFHAALRLAFAEAAASGSRELWLCDDDYADWPLGERDVIDALARWAASSRRLTVLARSFDEVARRHARWVEWRRRWAHIVHCRTNNELEAGDMPTLLLASGTLSVRLSDPVHHRGLVSHAKVDEIRCKEMIDAVSQRSTDAFPATTSGL
jgi:hypothetical protein